MNVNTFFLNHNLIKKLLILLLFSCVLLSSEIGYRLAYDIPSLDKYGETLIIILGLLILKYFARYRITRVIITFFFFLCTVVNNVHYQIYQSWINGINYWLMLKEISEVTHAGFDMISQWLPNAVWGFIEVLIFIVAPIKSSKTSPAKKNWAIADLLFVVMIVFVCAQSFSTDRSFGISPKTEYSRIKANYFSFGYFIGRILPNRLFNISSIPEYSHPMPQISSKPAVKNIIFIMGESETASHLSYFGYHRETSPFFTQFAQQHPEVVIKQTYSAGLMTDTSLPTLFNAIPHPNGMEQIIKGETNLFRLAKQQGFSTYFYSSQPEKQMRLANLVGTKWMDVIHFPTQEGYKFSERMPDKKLLPHLYRINLDKGSNFIVLHQRGSHAIYGEGLTEDEKEFKGNTPVDNYDSTIYHTDSIIKEVYNYLSQRETQDWLLIYTSDHGQSVSDKVQNQGVIEKQDNYIVPLFLWTPKSSLQMKISQVFDPCDKAFHQQLSTLLINIMGYDMPISGCNEGTVLGQIITGDAGYLQIQSNGKSEFIYPKKGGLTHKFRKAELE